MIDYHAPVISEDGKYLYADLELTPNIFAHLLVYKFDGKQFKRADAIKVITAFHIEHGGIANKSSYISVFKKATQTPLKKSISNPGYGIWTLRYQAESTEVFEPDEKIQPIKFKVDEVLGQGNGSVYVYYYDVYREIAEIKEERFWPCKIGMSDKDGMDRIFSQAGTAYPEAPHIALMIKCGSPRDVENALHAILKVRGQWISDAPGTEWFLTSPDDVKHIYYALVQTQNENL